MHSPTSPAPTDPHAIGPVLRMLEDAVRTRLASGDANASYTASLAARGRVHIARKLGEEAIETILAATGGTAEALRAEAADLVFHLTVLLAEQGLGWADVAAELARREGVSGHAEKAARTE